MSWSKREPFWSEGRDENYRVALLDQNERLVRSSLEGFAGGSIDINASTEIRATGQLQVVQALGERSIDWADYRIRPEYVLRVDGVTKVYPLGVYIPTTPKIPFDGSTKEYDLEFYDKTIILKQDCLKASKSFRKGSKITSAIRWLFDSIGEKKFVVDSSTRVFKKNQVFTAGTSKLAIMKKLLSMADFFPIWCDGTGYYRCHAYRSPSRRPIVYDFEAGSNAIHSGTWTISRDWFNVPNRVVCLPSKGKEKGVAEDRNSAKWGYVARGGRWVTKVVTGVNLEKKKDLEKKAEELLDAAQSVHDGLQITHAFLPLNIEDLVSFSSNGYSGVFALKQTSITLTGGVQMQSAFKGVSR